MNINHKATLLWLWISLLISSCSMRPTLDLQQQSPSMRAIYDGIDQPQQIEVPPPISSVSGFELSNPFPRLRNPTLHMYVFPHLVTASRVPIPGYWTHFPLYERIEFALPGEPTAQ